jgi:glycine dehydrogenase
MTDFIARHIGPEGKETSEMLTKIGVSSIEELVGKTIPTAIRLNRELQVDAGITEAAYLQKISAIGQKNQVLKSFIGLGYHETLVPSVILRNVLENPGWYTAYTPYQAEIAQGRLEALLNFQTMVLDLTGMEIANASLLDEGTAAAEAMIMFYNSRSREDVKLAKNTFLVHESIYPQTLDVVTGRALNLHIEIRPFSTLETVSLDGCFGALLQYPDATGHVSNIERTISTLNDHAIQVAVCSDLMALALLKSPGSMGADVVLGNSQRFGVPMGYGGPHAAFFSSKESYKRTMPGRIIGVSKDADDNTALRMALQTREQHIKRDKATSNICTAQALLAVMAGMYAVYHGPHGITRIATHIHDLACNTANGLLAKGHTLHTTEFFDTVRVSHVDSASILKDAVAHGMNLYAPDANTVQITFGEPHTMADVNAILSLFETKGNAPSASLGIPSSLKRSGEILTHPVFSAHHSESKMMRYLKSLENKDLSLVHSMIPLGSCTMKLNAASELIPITNPNFANMHPFAPK